MGMLLKANNSKKYLLTDAFTVEKSMFELTIGKIMFVNSNLPKVAFPK
jgi:hypothetical protein